MIGRIPAVIAALLVSFLVLSSPVLAGEWVPAGSHQPGFPITDVAVSGDGAYGALAGGDGLILLTVGGAECWRSPKGSYSSVALSGDGSILAGGGAGLLVLNRNTTVPVTVRSKNYVNDIAMTADGSRIVAAVDDETLRLYTLAGDLVWSTDTGDDLVSVSIGPDGTYIAGGTETGNVVLFSGTGDERWTYAISHQPVTSVAVADGARTIAAVSADGAVSLLSRAGGLLWSGSAPHAGGVSVSADGASVSVTDRQGIWFIERDGTPAGQIPGMDASVAAAMDGSGSVVMVTDGARISVFIREATTAAEGTGFPAAAAEKSGSSSAAPLTPTVSDNLTPGKGAPVSTQSPAPFVPVIAGLLLTTGLTAAGRRYRKNNPDLSE